MTDVFYHLVFSVSIERFQWQITVETRQCGLGFVENFYYLILKPDQKKMSMINRLYYTNNWQVYITMPLKSEALV